MNRFVPFDLEYWIEIEMFGELVPCGGGDAIPLLKSNLLVGRRSSCDITLRFSNVSSHHCKLELLNGFWHVTDLSSRNGIKVNDVRCESKWLLPGDVLSVAKHKYDVLYETTGELPPEEDEVDPFSIGLLEKAGLERDGSKRGNPDDPSTSKPDHLEAGINDDLPMEWLSEDE